MSLRWLVDSRSCCILIACLATEVAIAKAEPESVAILALASDEEEALATAFTDALRSEAEAEPTLRPSDSRASLSQMTMAQDCEIAESSCRSRIAAALSVQKVIYGELRAAEGAYQIELHMFGTHGGVQANATRQLPRGETSTADLARSARVMLRELRGAPEARSSEDAPRQSTIAPDVAPLHEAPIDDTERGQGHSTPASNDWIGYTLLGVSGVSLGLMVFSWTQIAAADDDGSLGAYRKAIGVAKPSVSDVCDEADKGVRYGNLSSRIVSEARDACSRGNTFERLQYVFLGAALVAAGVGTYFLLDNERQDRAGASGPRLALRPAFGRGSAALSLRLEM